MRVSSSPALDLVASATASNSVSLETESNEAFCLPLSALGVKAGTNASEARNATTGPVTSSRKNASHPARISFGTRSVTPHAKSDFPMRNKDAMYGIGKDTQIGRIGKDAQWRKMVMKGKGKLSRMGGMAYQSW